MNPSPVYLKPTLIVEPLFNQWYAWSYLIFPATAARYLTESHLKILQSFIDAPQVHQSALKNPAMMGGPFINYGIERVPEIQNLLAKTKTEQAQLIALSQAITQLDAKLNQDAQGYSLEPLYREVPEILKGYVELVYDANNHPSIRFLEGLLYKSPFYNPATQTVGCYLGQEDKRSFVLSTPRLPDAHYLQLNLPFNDSRLDCLFQMRDIPQPYDQIRDLLEITAADEALFASFFSEEPPRKAPNYEGDAVRIRYFGHACVLIETQEVSILCDPLISYQHEAGVPRYTYADLPETIDYALITHNHQDHCMFETLLQLRHKIKHLVVPKSNSGVLLDPSLKLILKTIGFSNVIEIDNLESIEVPAGQIIALPFLGEHGDLNISAKAAYLIQIKGKSILLLADSNNLEPKLYDKIYQLFGEIDVIFIGMECEGAPFSWAYGSLLTKPIPRKMDATRRLDGSNSERAFELVSQFNPQQVYVYAMGQEPWLTYITSIHYTESSRAIVESNKLVEACRTHNIISKRLLGRKEIILEPHSRRIPKMISPAKLNPSTPQQKVTQRIDEFLTQLSRLDIKLWVEGDRLRCNAPKGTLTPSLKTQLSERKAEILEFLSSSSPQQETFALLKADAVLDPAIFPESVCQLEDKPHYLLLTGATGFVGAFLLYELLQKTTADIYCLVRASSREVAQTKLRNSLASYQLWQDNFHSRIIPVLGDLSQPLLNLSETEFHTLAHQIDAIYHNGAWVHHASPYSLLKASNVWGTQEILRLACKGKAKPVHFMSASSVFSGEDEPGKNVINKRDNIKDYPAPLGGYNQSKWVAEQLVTAAQERGLPTCIYRLGRISGHSQTGVFNVNDFLYRLIIGCVQLGKIPDTEMMVDIIPVDYASQGIVHLSRQRNSWGKAFHFVHDRPVSSTLIFDQLRTLGYPIQRVPYADWHTQLLQIAESDPGHPLYPLVSLFPAKNSQGETPVSLIFDCQNTREGLAGTAITCPPLDRQLFNTYFSYLIERGFLAPPLNELKKAVSLITP